MKKILLILLITNSLLGFSQTLDTTFGTNGGIVTKQVSTTPSNNSVAAAILQPDGKMIYAGGSYVSRTTTLGSLDTSFNFYGFKALGSGLEALCLQDDGKILVAGLNRIFRLNTDGSLDTSFGTNGSVSVQLSGNNMYIKSIALKTNGQIIMAGYISNGTNDDFAVVSLNTNGSFNTFFDFDGIAVLDIANTNDEAVDMKIQSDGKIVVCGQSFDSTLNIYHFTTARFNSVGALDTTFGSSGYVITMLPLLSTNPTLKESKAKSLDIQDDGKIVVSGYRKSTATNTGTTSINGWLSVVRYTTTGALDTTFGTGGIALTTASYYINPQLTPLSTSLTSTTTSQSIYTCIKPQMIVKSDGNILISGKSGVYFALYQLNTNGSFDTNFGTNGVVNYNSYNTASVNYSTFLLISPNNEIITGGTPNFYIIDTVKFSETGSFISEQSFNLYQGVDSVSSLLEGPDGKIVVYNNYNTLLKYNVNGTLDTTFGTNGSLPLSSYGNSLTIQQDGKLLYVDNYSAQSIIRLNLDGSQDATFGNNGIVDFSTNTPLIVDLIDTITVAADGKIYLIFDYNTPTSPSWEVYTYYGIARLNNDGSIDTTFGTNGYVYVNFDYYSTDEIEWPQNLYEQADGKLIITGHISTSSPSSNRFNSGVVGTVRLNNDGQIDTSFGTNGKVISQFGGINDWGIFITKTINDKYIINIDSTTPQGRTNAILKLNYDGSTDTSFGINGVLADANYYDVAVQSDGKIIRASRVNNQFGIYRNNSDGSIDTGFGTNGLLSTPIYYYSGINKILILQNNKLLAGGYTFNGDSQIMALTRYTNLNLGALDFTTKDTNFMVYPNPIEEQATFTYSLKEAATVTIEIIDLQGKVVQSVLNSKEQGAGEYQQEILLPNEVASGNYILRFSSPEGNQSIKIIKK